LSRGVDWAKAYYQTATIALLLAIGWVALEILKYLGDVATILVSALLVAYVLQLVVDPLSKRMPRTLAVALVFLGVVIVLAGVGAVLVPLVIAQVRDLVTSLPEALSRAQAGTEHLQEWFATRNIRVDVQLQSWLMPRLQEASSYLTGNMGWFLASGFFSAFSVAMTIVCSFYFLLDSQRLWAGVSRLLPAPAALTLEYFRIELDKSLNNYFRGQVINASVVMVAATVAFSVLGMEYGVVGGLVWGTCEIIPMFGTYIGVGVCLLLALLQGGGIWWKVLLAAIVIQQIKDNIIAPRVMSHTMGLHPVVIILAVLTGAKLAGFLGILLAIPLAAVTVATLRVYLLHETPAEPAPDEAAAKPPPITTVLSSGTE